MSPRTWQDRLRDILDAIEEISTFTRNMDAEAFNSDRRTLRAVELNFIVIGEAASHIPEDVQQAHPEVPWSLMRAMRNRLVHVYFDIDPQIVWDTIQSDLPSLAGPLRQLLGPESDA